METNNNNAILRVLHFDPQYHAISSMSQWNSGQFYGSALEKILVRFLLKRDGMAKGWSDLPKTEYAQLHGVKDLFHRLKSVHCGRYVVITILSYLSSNPNTWTHSDALERILGSDGLYRSLNLNAEAPVSNFLGRVSRDLTGTDVEEKRGEQNFRKNLVKFSESDAKKQHYLDCVLG